MSALALMPQDKYSEWLDFMTPERLATTDTQTLLEMLSDLEREIHDRNTTARRVQ